MNRESHSSTAGTEEDLNTYRKVIKPPRILVVDNDDEMRGVIKRVLQNQGYDVIDVDNGAAAIRCIRRFRGKFPIEAVITDQWMPELTGLELAHCLRRTDGDWLTPIALVSAFVTDRICARAEELGVDDIIPKPFAVSELVTRTHRLAPPLVI